MIDKLRLTSSPSTRCHPNPDRRAELRASDMFSNINYFATTRTARTASTGDPVYGAPDNDRKMKEASWLTGQAFIESLRYYPKGSTALANNDCEATYSGCTHSARQVGGQLAQHRCDVGRRRGDPHLRRLEPLL